MEGNNRCVCCGHTIPEDMKACPNCRVVVKRSPTSFSDTIRKCILVYRKTWWLFWINAFLDCYLRVSARNKARYGKIMRMVARYNYIFEDDLLKEGDE